MTHGHIEIAVVQSRNVLLEASLLFRRMRMVKWHIMLLGALFISGVGEVLNGGISIQGELFAFCIVLVLYIGIMSFYRWRFVKKMRLMLEGRDVNTIKCTFTADALIISTNDGQTTISWNNIKAIIASSSVIAMTSNDGVVLPLSVSDLTKEMKEFICRRSDENRITVRGRQARRLLS
jgi:hypothetical protein